MSPCSREITKRTQHFRKKPNENAFFAKKNEPNRTQNEPKKATGEAKLVTRPTCLIRDEVVVICLNLEPELIRVNPTKSD
jgi:hypothetical protein